MLYWIARPWRQMFNFRGRATRREYWLFLPLLYFGWTVMVTLVTMVVVIADGGDELLDYFVVPFSLVSLGLCLIPYLSASVRRLHDHDKTGWLFLLVLVPLVGWIFYLIMMLTPGTGGENGYGSDPRRRGFSADDAVAVFS